MAPKARVLQDMTAARFARPREEDVLTVSVSRLMSSPYRRGVERERERERDKGGGGRQLGKYCRYLGRYLGTYLPTYLPTYTCLHP